MLISLACLGILTLTAFVTASSAPEIENPSGYHARVFNQRERRRKGPLPNLRGHFQPGESGEAILCSD
jgi:hypothetical protein